MLSEREQMLASYRLRLYLAVGVGALLAFALGLLELVEGREPHDPPATDLSREGPQYEVRLLGHWLGGGGWLGGCCC